MLADGRVRYLELNRLRPSLRSGRRLLLRIQGPLATKNQRRAQSELQHTKKKILEAIKTYKWKPSPRAQLAVSFRFFGREKNHADVSKFVKFYLDALKEAAFDDRQVRYLEASIWRGSPGKDSSVTFGEVRRLTDYCSLDFAGEADIDSEEHREHSFPLLF